MGGVDGLSVGFKVAGVPKLKAALGASVGAGFEAPKENGVGAAGAAAGAEDPKVNGALVPVLLLGALGVTPKVNGAGAVVVAVLDAVDFSSAGLLNENPEPFPNIGFDASAEGAAADPNSDFGASTAGAAACPNSDFGASTGAAVDPNSDFGASAAGAALEPNSDLVSVVPPNRGLGGSALAAVDGAPNENGAGAPLV